MNTKQSYMLFMTPNSCYRILGAKVLENGVSILITGACFFALGALDITLLFAKEGNLEELWQMIQRILTAFDGRLTLNLPVLAAFTADLLLSWVCTVMAAYLGEVISAALMNGKRYNGFLSIVLILALLIAVSWLQTKVGHRFDSEVSSFFLAQSGIALLCSVVMYFLTAWIMDRHLSV